MIKDWNRGEVKKQEVFHFKNSSKSFITVTYEYEDENYFLELDTMTLYRFEDLTEKGFRFYTKKDDDDYCGVQIDGFLTIDYDD